MTGSLTLSGDPTNALEAATKQYVDTGLSSKANSSTLVKTTLEASSWDSTTAVYTFESTYPSTSYDISIEPNGATITSTQYDAWGKAKILGNPDANTIKALGTIPTIDIPIVISVVSK